MNETERTLIRFDLPFGEAKKLWNTLCESAYIAHIMKKTDGNLSVAARRNSIDRKYLRSLIREYAINVHNPATETQIRSMNFDQTFKNAKICWMEFFEQAYLTEAFATTNIIGAVARKIRHDRKLVRKLLRKYRIGKFAQPEQTPQPQETSMLITQEPKTTDEKEAEENPEYIKLHRQFYNGINFERGMIAYLHFDGECTTPQGVHHLGIILGGEYSWYAQLRFGNWNRLQTLLRKLRILISARDYSVYDWNDALVPIEYKDALARKQAGEPVEKILAFYFPKEIN